MKFKITHTQYKKLTESLDPDVQDFFSVEKGKFHLLAPIPISRTTASEVIKRILKSENKKYFFGDDIDLNELSLVNRLRFGVYLEEVLSEVGTRGHNYEGFMAGLFDGYLPKDTNYWFDYRIREGSVEQKFIKSSGESPQLKTYANFIKNNPQYEGLLDKQNTPEIIKQKIQMLNSPEFLTDIYIFSTKTPEPGKGYRIDNYVVYKDEMIKILMNPNNLREPKQKGQTALRIPASVLGGIDFTIITPRYKSSELQELVKLDEKERAVLSAFGKHSEHIRPDVIKDLSKNLDEFIESLIEIQEEYE